MKVYKSVTNRIDTLVRLYEGYVCHTQDPMYTNYKERLEILKVLQSNPKMSLLYVKDLKTGKLSDNIKLCIECIINEKPFRNKLRV